jgi:hypothetical protein
MHRPPSKSPPPRKARGAASPPAQPQHGQQRTGSHQPRHPEGAHDATSGEDSRDEDQPWPEDDPFVNRDRCHQGPASGHEPVAGASLASVGYDGSTGELELSVYPFGITSLAAEAATIGQPGEAAA